jgi:hypothetical protein
VEALVRVPGARWRVEEAIKLAKSACGMAYYEVRSWHGWYRHLTLSQLAAAFLAVQAAQGDGDAPPPAGGREGGRRLRAWSLWRRLHQAVAQAACHWRRNRSRPPAREARPPPETTTSQPISN